MGCGCKNKNNGGQQAQPVQTNQQNNQSVQDLMMQSTNEFVSSLDKNKTTKMGGPRSTDVSKHKT